MAKSLNDILKVAHDRIRGVHSSTTSDLSTGKDPGVDYAPRAAGEQDFIAKHSVQKWDEPEGNPNYADKLKYSLDKETRHGYTEPKAKKVNESKKAEDTKCNKTPGQTWCPLHEMADCSKSTTIKEDSEYGMARNELATASRAIDRLNAKMGKGEGELEAWVQAKITKASDYLDTVADYMESGTIKEAYDDNSTKVSDWSDKKLKWHASDDRKHSSSHVPAWSELKRRAKTSAPKKTNEEVEEIEELSSALLYRAKQSAQKKAGWLMPGDGGKGDKAWNRVKKFRDAGVAKEKQEKAAVKEEVLDEKMTDMQKKTVKAIQTYRDKAGIAKPSITDTKRSIKFVKQNEEVEQIDELSPATLTSYKAKAAGSEKALTDKSSTLSVPAKDRNVAAAKANQRRQGMNLATKKLGEEAIDEISKDLTKSYIRKATQDVDNTPEDDDNATRKLNNRESGIRTASMKKNASKYVKVPATEEVVSEVLTKSTTADKTIDDFVHSKNPQFAGKSKEKRKQMALAAYYAKQRNEETDPGFKEGHVPDHQPKLAPKDASTMSKVAAMMAKERESFRQRQAGNTAKLVAANKSGKDS